MLYIGLFTSEYLQYGHLGNRQNCNGSEDPQFGA